MRTGLVISGVMHGGAVIVAILGLSIFSEEPPEKIEAAQVEIISAAVFDRDNSGAPDIVMPEMFEIAAPDLGGEVGDAPDEEVAHENIDQEFVEAPSAQDLQADLRAVLEQLLQPDVVVEVAEIDETTADPFGGLALATMPGIGADTSSGLSLPSAPSRPGLGSPLSPSPAFAPPALPTSSTTSDRKDEPPVEEETPVEEDPPVEEENLVQEDPVEEPPVDEGNLIATSSRPVQRPRDFPEQIAAIEEAIQTAERERLAQEEQEQAARQLELEDIEEKARQARLAEEELERQQREAAELARLLIEAQDTAAAEDEVEAATSDDAADGTDDLNVTAENDPTRQAGPPLSQTEKDGLRIAIQKCWIQPTGLSETADLRVVIGVDFDANGELSGNPTLVEPSQLSSPEMKAVFETGRRAIIRCNGKYNLPTEKYETWKYIEVEFNPRGILGF